jgi:FlaA1/EpsC-like NDP-sugar epimerase
VTHPDATRYFMTIPEAVQLILQASLLPAIRGQIAMLEMGEPVRIAELAKNLLRLSGADAVNGNGSGVVYTGLRPGEKLHEELTAPDEGSRATSVQKIRLVVPTQTVAPRICHSIRNDRSPSDTGRAVDSLANTLAGLFPNLQFNEAPPKRRQATGIGRTA